MPQFQLQIKRAGVTKATVEIDESTVYNGEFMGMDKITTSFITTAPIPIQLDDYIEYDAGKGLMPYKIKSAIGMEQVDSKTFKYDITFFSPTYDMYDEEMIHLGHTKFSYSGTPLELLSLIVDCMNADAPGWSIGDCSLISEPIEFAFDQQSPRTALTQVAEAFGLEYKIVGKTISLIEKVGTLQNITLRYGRGQGLTNAARQSVDESFYTVWRGYGGIQNILPSYRDGMDRLTLDAPYEINVDKYGRKKGSVTFEDIYPRRTSTLTSVAGLLEFADSTLDFDLNAQTKTDGGAKIVFKSGELSGKQFSISNYDHSTKTMRIRPDKNDAGNPVPNATFEPQVGDKYTLIGITMPDSYFIAAHAELQAALEKHAKAHSFPPVAFPLNIDEKYIREMGLTRKLVPGDSINAISESMGVNTPLRLQSVSWPLVNPDLITGVVSDVVQYSTQERLINDVKDGKKEIAKSVAVALNTRQIADEIANNAILDQFRKTYVGERVVMTGAFVAGNPESGEVAGINGADDDLEAVRFWAGSSYADKETAPFRVTQGGQVTMTKATLQSTTDGKRIEINSLLNNLRLYGVLNGVLIELDDDSALEGYSIQPNDPPLPPTINPIYGPGIRVGLVRDVSNLGYSSMGRKGFSTDAALEMFKKGGYDKFVDINPESGDALINLPLEAKSYSIRNDDGTTTNGISVRVAYQTFAGTTRHMVFVNGILTEEGAGS